MADLDSVICGMTVPAGSSIVAQKHADHPSSLGLACVAGLLFSAADPVKADPSAITVLTADAAVLEATTAGADQDHKFLDGLMSEAVDSGANAAETAASATTGAVAGTGSSTGSGSGATDAGQQVRPLDDTGDVIGIGVAAEKAVPGGTAKAAKAATTAVTELVDKAEAVAGSAAPEARPLGLYFKEDVREEAKKGGGAAVAQRQAIARLKAAAGAADGGVNDTKPLGFYFGLNANEKDQAGLTVGGKDDSQGVAAGIKQKAAAQLAERGGEVRRFSLARRASFRRSFRRASRMLLGSS